MVRRFIMKQNKINGHLFAKMIDQGAINLRRYVKQINALNVFPVPDGDTGTNMNLSFTSGVEEMRKQQTDHIGDTTKFLSKGLLMRARGNSGVILSQLFRGFAKDIEGNADIDAQQFAKAFQAGVETAYKAVMKPVEGTILTVAKDSAHVAKQSAQRTDDVIEVMAAVLEEAKQSLERTPQLLKVLRDVGVVDSGGQGLVYVYEGFLATLKGESLPDETDSRTVANEQNHELLENKEEHVHNEVAEMMASGVLSVDDIHYGYCTEFMILLSPDASATFKEDEFQTNIGQFGDSLLVISDEELVKVHIHAEELNEVLGLAQRFGELTNIKIENMREQFKEVLRQNRATIKHTHDEDEETKKKFSIMTVSAGSGLADIFKSLGADVIIPGGQTMNPSTEDFVKAINIAYAEHVLILPNNRNVILAAEQAADLVDLPVAVVPTKDIGQGLAAILSFQEDLSLEENRIQMTAAKEHVQSGQMTHAIWDTEIDGLHIKKDHIIGILNGKIVVTDEQLQQACLALIAKMVDEDSEMMTLIYGADVKEQEASQLQKLIEEQFTDLEIELLSGGQPLYPYFISIE